MIVPILIYNKHKPTPPENAWIAGPNKRGFYTQLTEYGNFLKLYRELA